MGERLISLVCRHPILFDPQRDDYRDIEAKEQIWSAIAHELGCEDVCELKRQWRNLRDQYVKCKRKEHSPRSGHTLKKKKKWKYFDALTFLEPILLQKRMSTNFKIEMEIKKEDVSEESEGETAVETCMDSADPRLICPSPKVLRTHPPSSSPSSNSCLSSPGQRASNNVKLESDMKTEDVTEESEGESTVQPAPSKEPVKVKKKARQSQSDFIEQYLRNKEARQLEREKERREKDDAYHFCISLAPQLRRLSPEKQSWLKIKIQQLVHEAEFGPF